jgi:ABC-2 type transport system permease protein
LTEPALTRPGVTNAAATDAAVAGAAVTDPGDAGSPVAGSEVTRSAAPQLLNDGWPAPAPGAALLPRMVRGQAALELRTLARNGEQLLLTLIIPLLLLFAFGHENLVSIGSGSRIDFVVPGILALAVLSTAFTSQAIGTGFERRYGVLKRLGATPLSRRGLIAAKTLTVLTVELGQFAIVLLIGALLGWRPAASPAAVVWVPLLLLAGTAAFSGIALLMAGTLRAEATLAGANLLYLILLGLGGILFPLTKFPAGIRPVLKLLPAGALSDGLRATLAHSAGLPLRDLLVLCVWAIVAIAVAARTFRWE